MSKVNEEVQNENLNKEVVETTETQEMAVMENKKFNLGGPKAKKRLKTALKVLGVVGLGVFGYALGVKCGSRKNDESDEVEYEVIDEDSNE